MSFICYVKNDIYHENHFVTREMIFCSFS